MIAIESGLEPLADQLMEFSADAPEEIAKPFVNEEAGVNTVEDALAGARDIVAERFADDAAIRENIRKLAWSDGTIVSAIRKGQRTSECLWELL